MSASVDDSLWNAADVTVVTASTGVDFVAKTDSMWLWVHVEPPISAGTTYVIGAAGSHTISAMKPGSRFWGDAAPGTAGSITVTNVSATRVSGTFSATLGPGNGASLPLVITNGAFNVRRGNQ